MFPVPLPLHGPLGTFREKVPEKTGKQESEKDKEMEKEEGKTQDVWIQGNLFDGYIWARRSCC